MKEINGLLVELRKESDSAGSSTQLQSMLSNENIAIVVAKDGERIVGYGLLLMTQKLGKRIGFVEDIIVSEACRGQGIGKEIMNFIIEEGRKRSCTYLFLTSKPDRVAANSLYQKLGFELLKTNPYRLKL